jgi:hypothetical protein
MNVTEVRDKPLSEYVSMIRNSFNGNNHVFEVDSSIEGGSIRGCRMRYVSNIGFNEMQNQRPGLLLTHGSYGSINVNGIYEYLVKLEEKFTETNADFISTVIYEQSSGVNKLIIGFYK